MLVENWFDPIDHIHGSYFIARRPDLFSHGDWEAPLEFRFKGLRLTVDEPADYVLIDRIYKALTTSSPTFGIAEVIGLLSQSPEWALINSSVQQKHVREG